MLLAGIHRLDVSYKEKYLFDLMAYQRRFRILAMIVSLLL